MLYHHLKLEYIICVQLILLSLIRVEGIFIDSVYYLSATWKSGVQVVNISLGIQVLPVRQLFEVKSLRTCALDSFSNFVKPHVKAYHIIRVEKVWKISTLC